MYLILLNNLCSIRNSFSMILISIFPGRVSLRITLPILFILALNILLFGPFIKCLRLDNDDGEIRSKQFSRIGIVVISNKKGSFISAEERDDLVAEMLSFSSNNIA